jgi:hypothetical protein
MLHMCPFCDIPSCVCRFSQAFVFLGDIADFALRNLDVSMADPVVDPSIHELGSAPGLAFGIIANHSPVDGVIENVSGVGGVFGYGLVQIGSGERLHFRNLDGTGGVTLRLESASHNTSGYINEIYGDNIVCRNGHAAFTAAPHCDRHGSFSIRNVTAVSCNAGVTVGPGQTYDPVALPGCKLMGSFSNSSRIDGVHAIYGVHAQGTAQDSNTPACVPCLAGLPKVPLNWECEISNIEATGFPAPTNRTECVAYEYWWPGHCYYNASQA